MVWPRREVHHDDTLARPQAPSPAEVRLDDGQFPPRNGIRGRPLHHQIGAGRRPFVQPGQAQHDATYRRGVR